MDNITLSREDAREIKRWFNRMMYYAWDAKLHADQDDLYVYARGIERDCDNADAALDILEKALQAVREEN